MIRVLHLALMAGSLNFAIGLLPAIGTGLVEGTPKPSLLTRAYATEKPPTASQTSSVSVPATTAPKHRLHRPLPPVAMPGILNDFEPSLAKRGRRRLLSQLRYLKDQFTTLERPVIRKRRSPTHPKPIPQMLTLSGSRSRRDLRRLRRDLGYDTPVFVEDLKQQQQPSGYPAITESHQLYRQGPVYVDDLKLQQPSGYPAIAEPRQQYRQGASFVVPSTHAQSPELNRLLRDLNFLQQLSLLAQSGGITEPLDSDQKSSPALPPPSAPLHAPPSRFAPQPKLFLDEDRRLNRPMQMEHSRVAYRTPAQASIAVPEKRWLAQAGSGLSMVPGFKKRSAFREWASRSSPREVDVGSAYEWNTEDFPSQAAIFGVESGPKINRLRGTAM